MAVAWGAHLAGQVLAESADLGQVGEVNQPKLERVRIWLVGMLRDERFPAVERALAGTTLARLGDPRFDPDRWFLPREPLLGFVEIPAGRFLMGSQQKRDRWAQKEEMPQHEVDLPGFFLARYPVTVEQFRVFVGLSGKKVHPASLEGAANHPVHYVSWYDARSYCKWLGKRLQKIAKQHLPTVRELARGFSFWEGLARGAFRVTLPSEAEWEKAARGTDGRTYPWGDEVDSKRANLDQTGIGAVSTVGCFPGGVSPFGCEELSGNVSEWTRSLWGEASTSFKYPYVVGDGREDREAPARFLKVARGSSFIFGSNLARCSYRERLHSTYQGEDVGFRVALVHSEL